MNDGDLTQAGQASLKSLPRQAPFAPCLPFWMSASPEGLPREDDVDVSRIVFLSFFHWFKNPFKRVVAGVHPLWGEPPMVRQIMGTRRPVTG